MANNPLEQFFRQPKIFINLPSSGAYQEAGVCRGRTYHRSRSPREAGRFATCNLLA